MTGAREENTRRTGGAGRARWALLAVAAAVAAAGCPLTDDFVISGGAPGGAGTSASAGGAQGAGAGGDTGAGGAGGSGCGAMCPCEHRLFGGHAYLFCAPTQTWIMARDACSVLQYHLVTIDSLPENTFVFDVARTELGFTRWYIGFNDLAQESTWVWADGTPTTYTNWHPVNATEPNGGTTENCGAMSFYSDGTWDDIDCNNLFSYVCEAGGE